MKQLLLFVFLFGMTSSAWSQIEENLFEWQVDDCIATKSKYLDLYCGKYTDYPTHVYKEYNISDEGKSTYQLKIKGFEETMSMGAYDGFEIYYNGRIILDYLAGELLYNVENITVDSEKSLFIRVPLSDNSFALFFGGWPYDGGDAPELVVVVVAADKAKVVYDGRALAYKYMPVPDFSIEFVTIVGNLYEKYPLVFSESFLKSRTKHKIWKEGNMLKYKSWE